MKEELKNYLNVYFIIVITTLLVINSYKYNLFLYVSRQDKKLMFCNAAFPITLIISAYFLSSTLFDISVSIMISAFVMYLFKGLFVRHSLTKLMG